MLGLAGAVAAGYITYEDNCYYQTDNAKVDTTIYQLTANARGKLEKVYVAQNDAVKAGQVLARVENGTFIKSPIDGTVTSTKLIGSATSFTTSGTYTKVTQ